MMGILHKREQRHHVEAGISNPLYVESVTVFISDELEKEKICHPVQESWQLSVTPPAFITEEICVCSSTEAISLIQMICV